MLESLKLTSHYGAGDVFQKRTGVSRSNETLDSNQQRQASHSDQLSDEALMLGYAKGNMRAFEQLYQRHKNPLLRYFLRQVDSRATAEELFQETWQSVIKASDSYKVSAKFTTWLYYMARNKLIDHYRKQVRGEELSLDEQVEIQPAAHSVDEPEQQLNDAQSKQQYLWALGQLPPAQREVLVLKIESAMTVQEIAETIQDNAEAVKSRLRYAVQKLKQLISEARLEVEL